MPKRKRLTKRKPPIVRHPLAAYLLTKDETPLVRVDRINLKRKLGAPNFSITEGAHLIANVWTEESAELVLIALLIKRLTRKEVVKTLKTLKPRLNDAFSISDLY